MTKLSFATKLTLGIWVATALALAGPISAQAEDFDKKAAATAAAKLGKQVDGITKSFEAIPADKEGQSAEQRRVVHQDLKYIEGHSKHVSQGLHAGLNKSETEKAVESLLKLIKKVRDDAKGANFPEPMQAQIADAQVTIQELAGLYGVDLSDVGSGGAEAN
jgi:hypothetical protein